MRLAVRLSTVLVVVGCLIVWAAPINAERATPHEWRLLPSAREDQGVTPMSPLITSAGGGEGFDGTWIPDGWIALNYGTDPAGLTWIQTTGNPFWGEGAAFVPYGLPAEMQNEWLISPAIDLSSGPVAVGLIFRKTCSWCSYATHLNYVKVSTADDPTDTTAYVQEWSWDPFGTSDFVWSADTVNLTSYAGDTIYIAWQYLGNWAENWYLDDIRVVWPTVVDLGVISLEVPDPWVLVDSTYTPEAMVENFGIGTQQFDVICQIDTVGGTAYCDTVNIAALAAGDVTIASFDPWTPDAADMAYAITVSIGDISDGVASNDTITANVWCGDSYEYVYDDGTPEATIAQSMNWYGNWFDAYYTPIYLQYLDYYVMDYTGDFIAVVYDSVGVSELFRDTVTVSVTDDWYRVDLTSHPLEVTRGFMVSYHPLSAGSPQLAMDAGAPISELGYSYYSSQWNTLDGDYPGVDLMIRATASIDSTSAAYVDAAVVSIDAPTDTVIPGVPVDPMATVANYGTANATFWTFCMIDSLGTEIYIDSLEVVDLMPDSMEQLTFAAWTPGPAGTTYDIEVCTYLAGDMDPGNDCLTAQTSSTGVSGGDDDLLLTPKTYFLGQNKPNPFQMTTSISYALPHGSRVTLGVYNIVGQLVRTVVDEWQPANVYSVAWDGRDEHGREVASGVYIYRLETEDFTATRKMVTLK